MTKVNNPITKSIQFLGDSLDDIKAFPANARRDAGHELDRVQRDLEPSDWKPMKSIGAGVREIRIRDEQGIYRVLYVAKYLDSVLVLHAFKKKTGKTAKKDIDTAKQRLKIVLQEIK